MAIEAEALRALSVKATEGPWYVHDFADPAISSNPSPSDVTISCDHPATITVAFMGNSLTATLEEARDNAHLMVALANAYRDNKLFHIDALSTSSAVHINLLRGTIAKPSVEQILHLYPDLIHRSALAEDTARAAEGWKPIETAPRDGTIILLFARDRFAHEDTARGKIAETKIRSGYFTGEWWSHPFTSHFPPTHWRPLPAPPALPLDKEVADANR